MPRKNARAQKRRNPRPQRHRGTRAVTGFIGIAVALTMFGGVLVYVFGNSPEPDAPPVAAGDDGVRVIEGSVHTVRHTEAPLPSSDNPRADGLPTLVWFSGTWCHFCEAMSPFAHDTAEEFTGELVFVEKSVDHDRDAANSFGVRGTPTFVLIDDTGGELVRFGYQPDPQSFRDVITEALAVSGG